MHKILVVDDEREICDFVKNFFQERGYDVVCAESGEEALAITKADAPGIVLLDIKMAGGMDGIATLKHMREANKSLRVVIVSALDDQDRINEACRLGAVDYITKPLSLDHLEQTVEKILR